MKPINILFSFLFVCIVTFSCKKSEYLDANPDSSLVIPETFDDLQAILDNDGIMNGNQIGTGVNPAFGEFGADNYYLTPSGLGVLASLSPSFQNLYTWNDNIYDQKYYDWAFPYRCVFYANVVLDGLVKIDKNDANSQTYNNIKGNALFFRGEMFYNLSQIFSPQYNSATANTDLGIALKLSSDVNEKVSRASLQDSYTQCIKDLMEAKDLLPVTPMGGYKTRSSKPAVLAMLSRVYLSMKNYDSALVYANSCLQLYNRLLDYNGDVGVGSGTFSFARNNPEVIFQSMLVNATVGPMMGATTIRVDSNLLKSYNVNDLRSTKYFLNRPDGKFFRGSYDGSLYFFGGIATDEVYLIRAECYARKGDKNSALADLNTLMIKRWKNSVPFPTFIATDATDALNKILIERRKELCFRGLRWSDLRRLNSDGANITLTRFVNNQTFTLPSNSLKYTYLIPPDVMNFNPSMLQNPR